MRLKSVYIYTIGCQMNVYDSELMAASLKPLGYETGDNPEEADAIIVNTCTIREKAEQKAFSFLGRLPGLKTKNPSLIIAVGGCVAQQEGRAILKRMPHVDLVFGTRAVSRLSDHFQVIEKTRRRIVDVLEETDFDSFNNPGVSLEDLTLGAVCRFVTIMQGCDNYCTYCVVPHVRGREKSRTPDAIYNEIETLTENGVREVTLLGQNVNSYGIKEGHLAFPGLLRKIHAIPGLLRIRFTTSHPKDLSHDLISAFAELDKLCPHIHLPVQSGSNDVLRRMNRKYTREVYLDKVNRLKGACPEIALTSDFIVGFPGETDGDFDLTMDLIETVGYDGVFAFKYSDRPIAPASRFKDKIDEEVKSQRLSVLLSRQEEITAKKNGALVGETVTVLVEGTGKPLANAENRGNNGESGQSVQWTGRTPQNKIVHFCLGLSDETGYDHNDLSGHIVEVRITRALSHSLWGEAVLKGKGRRSHAA